jgi:hypothetical protein
MTLKYPIERGIAKVFVFASKTLPMLFEVVAEVEGSGR